MYVKLNTHILKLGKEYLLSFYNYKHGYRCKLIKVTKCGYNLLNIETNKCMLKQHLYVPTKCRDQYNDDTKLLFNIIDIVYIREIKNEIKIDI
jgi:hypothetical protein